MPDSLIVFREYLGKPQVIGELTRELLATFRYDDEYVASANATPVSSCLPLQTGPFDSDSTADFFEGLVPEGSRRRDLARALRGDAASFSHLLSNLNDETVGALLFSKSREAPWVRGYERLDEGWQERFAAFPAAFSLEMGVRTRMSLAGAQDKVGLAFHDGAWYLPQGGAPSTHIIKAASPAFPGETLNEALCIGCARRLDIETEAVSLIPVAGKDPLLAARRFDRVLPEHPDVVDGIPAVWRLHQEDLCQASGLTSSMKYEPTDGHYASRVATTLQARSSSPAIDRPAAFERLCFDYAIGNCDNHLKNRALLYDAHWKNARLAPMYDVMCTTIYPGLYREMGVSLGNESRCIDDATPQDVLSTARAMGVFSGAVAEILDHIVVKLASALEQEGEALAHQGNPGACKLAARIIADARPRIEVLRRATAMS